MRPAIGNQLRLASARVVVLMFVVGVLLFAADSTAYAAGSASVTITPGPAKGAFADQQTVRVSVGPNSVFTPNSRVVLLECADPGGTVANLPTGFSSCDENTIQPDTTVVHTDGSFVEPSYTLYALPSKVLGEQANWQPVCNTTQPCVLFVGEDQNDFSKAKTFSAAFTVSGGTLPVAPAAANATTTPATTASAPVSAAVSLSATQLAFTGTSGWLVALGAIGAALILLAWAVATLVRRSVR
jgi:hypothetical protein